MNAGMTRDLSDAIDDQVVEHLLAGESLKAIAELLGLGYHQVTVRLCRLRQDCGCSSNAELAYQLGVRDGVRLARRHSSAQRTRPAAAGRVRSASPEEDVPNASSAAGGTRTRSGDGLPPAR